MPAEREVFDRLFFDRDRTQTASLVHSLLILGLCTYRKCDRVTSWEEQPDGPEMPVSISSGEIEEKEFQEIRARATTYLEEYVDLVRPQQAKLKAAVEEALDGALEKVEKRWSASRFWWDVWKNVVGGIAFAVLVALILWALALGGIDLPGIEIRTTSPPSAS